MQSRQKTSNIDLDLDRVFSVPRMQRAWKETVRLGLRRQPLGDLHDFLDVHRNLGSYLQALRSDVLSGNYRPQPPEIVLLEKRDGISRRLALPSPADALLLQTVVEVLEKKIRATQPHSNAFYARSHTGPTLEDVDSTFAYAWWLLWPQFQERIWRFTEIHDYVLVTDIGNYFDCIPLASLRNAIASMGAFNENVLNFLFYLLDAFVWRPFYTPNSGVGLPQINFDAPRLLAHAFLFKADHTLHKGTNGDFVRWMDDINCGIDHPHEARGLLQNLETVLNSQGIRLNVGKTKILTSHEAIQHFWIQENRALTIAMNLIRQADGSSPSLLRVRDYLGKRFRTFVRKKHGGHWDKVYKRYFTIFGTLRDKILEKHVPTILDSQPELRESICRYYTKLGFSRLRFAHLETYLLSGRCVDDASLCEIVRTLVDWRIPLKGPIRERVVKLADAVAHLGSHRIGFQFSVAGVSAGVWLLAKYGTPPEIVQLLTRTSEVWTRSNWAARQVAAVLPRLAPEEQDAIRVKITSAGLTEGLRVLASIDQLSELKGLDKQLSAYLLHVPDQGYTYPLPKVLVALTVVRSKIPVVVRRDLRKRIRSIVGDPRYRRLLRFRHSA